MEIDKITAEIIIIAGIIITTIGICGIIEGTEELKEKVEHLKKENKLLKSKIDSFKYSPDH